MKSPVGNCSIKYACMYIWCQSFFFISGTDEKCYPPYGCFDRNPPWNDSLFVLPEDLTHSTVFKLYNAAKPNGVVLNNTHPTTSDLKAGDKIVVLVHGLAGTHF